MGCDIHPAIEVYQDYGNGHGYWEAVAIPDRSRCYPFFEALAGVRRSYSDNPPKQICERRGFPDDMSYTAREDLCTGDHSESWFSLREAKAYDSTSLKTAYNDSNWPFRLWERWFKTMQFFAELYEVTDDQVRVLYNFDS